MMSYYGGIGGVGWDEWTSEQGDAKSTYDTEIGFFIPTFYLSETESVTNLYTCVCVSLMTGGPVFV